MKEIHVYLHKLNCYITHCNIEVETMPFVPVGYFVIVSQLDFEIINNFHFHEIIIEL